MKYLTVIENLEYRGSQRVAQNYSIGMKQLGHEVRVLTISGLGPRADYLTREGIEFFCLKLDQNAFQHILNWPPDVVHIHRPGMYDQHTNPIIRDIKNAINPLILETNIFSRVDYQMPSKYIDLHLHLTEWCLWKWLEWSKALNYNPLGTVLPYSLISDDFYRSTQEEINTKKQELKIPENDFVFGRIGANSEAKWHPVVVDAFEKVAKQNNNISLILVSPPQSVREQVKNLPSQIRHKVFILPSVVDDNELRLLYSMMDVMLHASRIGESFGMVLAESLLCETPVITLSSPTKDNSQVEIIEHNKTGKVVNSKNAFADVMKEILGDYSKVSKLGKNGRVQVLQKFGNEQICTQIDLLCNLLVNNRNQPHEKILKSLKDNGFTTNISQKKILKKLDAFNGNISIYDRLMTKLVHQPILYKFYTSSVLSLKHAYFSRVAR